MSGDSDRDVILARRRIFVAGALATLAATQTRCDNPLRPCLTIVDRPDAEPLVCLSAPPRETDGAVSTAAEAGADADAEPPAPCLSVPALAPDAGRDAAVRPPTPPGPSVCLSPVPPRPCLKPVTGGPR